MPTFAVYGISYISNVFEFLIAPSVALMISQTNNSFVLIVDFRIKSYSHTCSIR